MPKNFIWFSNSMISKKKYLFGDKELMYHVKKLSGNLSSKNKVMPYFFLYFRFNIINLADLKVQKQILFTKHMAGKQI